MRIVSIMVAGGIWTVLSWSQSTSGSAPVPDRLIADPQHYHLEFQNQWVRVIREKIGPHESALLHRHPAPGAVVIYLTDQNILQTQENGSTRSAEHKAGDATWSSPSAHQARNLSDRPFEAIAIEPKAGVAGAAAPVSAAENKLEAAIVDPQHYHVEFENDLVRVIRFPMGAHDKTLMHTHPATGAVIVALTDQNTRQTLADGTSREIRHKAGEAWWGAPNIAHQDENANDTRAVVIRIELKQAR
jgi:hypothetical protein